MKILIACDKFKGSLSAESACRAISRGYRGREVEISTSALSDGGEGFSALMAKVYNGERVSAEILDPMGRRSRADYWICGDVAIMEVAAACGLAMVEPEFREPEYAASGGVGMMIRDAIENYAVKKIIIGLGGSATNDGGVGMAVELGAHFSDQNGRGLMAVPADMQYVAKADLSGLMDLPKIIAACDVTNPLLGVNGATSVFASQKGASDLELLESMMESLVRVTDGSRFAVCPGAGAAGGIGYGLMRFTGAELVPGFDLLAQSIGLAEQVRSADLVITGEGSLDKQTAGGKVAAGVAELARKYSKPVHAYVGRAVGDAVNLFDRCYTLESLGVSEQESMQRTEELLEKLVAQSLLS